nr:LEM domain-containing protein 1 isoform X2 [Microcebus murinus]
MEMGRRTHCVSLCPVSSILPHTVPAVIAECPPSEASGGQPSTGSREPHTGRISEPKGTQSQKSQSSLHAGSTIAIHLSKADTLLKPGFRCQKRGQTSVTMVDVKCLDDSELQSHLEKLGFSPGPILPSTRKLYEKKLVQLLVSPPCAAPVMSGPREQDGPQDCDDSEEINIMLKGNIRLSTEKGKELKKRVESYITKPKPVDVYCLECKPSGGIRCAARAPSIRSSDGTVNARRDCWAASRSAGSSSEESFPVGLKLAVLGIFIIVVFVYITVEKKPLFG